MVLSPRLTRNVVRGISLAYNRLYEYDVTSLHTNSTGAQSEGQMNFKALALATDISPPGPPSPHQQNTYSNPFVVPKPHHQNSELILLSICSLPLRHVPSIVRSPPSFPQLTPGIFTSPSDLNYSIREFCPLTLPIFMHGKDGNYVVKTLQEVRLPLSPLSSPLFPIHPNPPLMADTQVRY